jgi:hypothetical protein
MKKIILLFCLYSINSIYAQIPTYVPTNGLIAYYPFNGNANDVSGNGNNGTVNGATLATDRFGNVSSTYNYNGINSFISTNFMPPTLNQSRTISLWFNDDDASSMTNNGYTYSIVSYGASTDICSQAGGRFELNVFYNQSASGRCLRLDGLCTATYAQSAYGSGWHNFTVTYDNSFGNFISNSKMYIDGALITTSNYNASTIINTLNLTNFTIGKSPSSNSPTQRFFKGSIDDIGVWNRALTQQEITNLYTADNTCQSLVINTGMLSFNPVTYTNTVTIYPNPANDQITIDCGTQQDVVPLNTWTGQGVYFVKIYDAQGTLVNTKKIILQ